MSDWIDMMRRFSRQKPLWPVSAPGMPPVGSDLLVECNIRGDRKVDLAKPDAAEHSELLEDLLRDILYGKGDTRINLTVGHNDKRSFPVVPGHLWGWDPNGPSAGPMPADVMVVGKNLGQREVEARRCHRGAAGQLLLQTLQKLGVQDVGKWYVTNILKTEHLNGERGALKAMWVKNQLHLLHQELRLVRPRFLLCLGADAVKMLIGKNMTLGKMEGRVYELDIPIGTQPGDTDVHRILVMACPHPAAVISTPELTDRFERSLGRFHQLTHGDRWDQAEPDIDHRVVRTESELLTVFKEAEKISGREGFGKIIGMDAEWHGDHPQNDNAYLRTIQISWGHKKAAVIVVHEAGGQKVGFHRTVRNKQGKALRDKATGRIRTTTNGAIPRLMQLLQGFLADKRLALHQGNADHEWMLAYGLDLRRQWTAPEDFRDCRMKGPLDTSLMAHSIDETGDFTLTGQTIRYTEAPRYDVQLYKWREAYCSANSLKASQLEGYGDCPDSVLYHYAAYDSDVTRRLAIKHIHHLDCDQFGNNCWEAYWMSMQAAMPCLEIGCTGLLLDKERVDSLTMLYMEAKQQLGKLIRDWARWPELNLESRFHVAELLFGEKYNGHPKDQNGSYRRLRPTGARSVGALPVLTTDKRPRPWHEVMADRKESEYTASTNKQVLGMLLHTSKQLRCWTRTRKKPTGGWIVCDRSDIIGWIRDYRFISQVLKSVLRVPTSDENDQFVEDDDGCLVYSAGIAGSMCSDGRVRTFISQLKETGRWASSRPPLQNISKRREADYKRILESLGLKYKGALRSIFMADPNYVLVEADYTGAELFGMALMAGDAAMIEHARRNLLPDDDPDFYDIHSNIAVRAFSLNCPPTKGGLADIGKKHLRIVAKSVIFGVAYGRGAKAIAIAAKEEGVDITEAEAQAVIDAIFASYPGLVDFFEECRARAVTQPGATQPAPRWLCNPFGRFRRFPLTDDRKAAGDMERQAQNFPIQGMIADAVSLAISHIYKMRQRMKLDFKIVLQIHDAIVLLVHKDHVNTVCEQLLPECMERRVAIYRCSLDGMPVEGGEPYHLGIGLECATHWGEPMYPDECFALGFDPRHTGWRKSTVHPQGWENPETFGGKIWLESDCKLHKPEELAATAG